MTKYVFFCYVKGLTRSCRIWTYNRQNKTIWPHI